MKTAVVCMVQNGLEYISEFLLHHLGLCDHLFLIDHNSNRDLRFLRQERVTVIRSNHTSQFQSECTNLVIHELGISQQYDWLFVLDIDEFLPFAVISEFHEFLKQHETSAAVRFYWRNGVPFFQSGGGGLSLVDCPSIRFFKIDSIHSKVAVNVALTKGRFLVPTGAHDIHRWMRWPILSKIPRFNSRVYDAVEAKLPLYHVVAFDKQAFVRKISNYVKQMEYRKHVKGQGGGSVKNYPATYQGDEWLWYIANFRVAEPRHNQVRASDFISEPMLGHLNREEVLELRDRLYSLPLVESRCRTQEEVAYLQQKCNDASILDNLKWFKLCADFEIFCQIPGVKR